VKARPSRAGRYRAPGVIDAKLTAKQFELEIYIDGYAFPNFDTGRDANALACEIELDLQGQRLDLHATPTR
jgi:hypothetical protein